jgi:hypothetical protein
MTSLEQALLNILEITPLGGIADILRDGLPGGFMHDCYQFDEQLAIGIGRACAEFLARVNE